MMADGNIRVNLTVDAKDLQRLMQLGNVGSAIAIALSFMDQAKLFGIDVGPVVAELEAVQKELVDKMGDYVKH